MQSDERLIRWEKYTLYVDESHSGVMSYSLYDSLAISSGA